MSKVLPPRRGIAERAMFYLVIYGIGAFAFVVGALVDSVHWAARWLSGD